MITSMCKAYGRLVCVTNRHLCTTLFLEQIERVVRLHPRALILREKDLPEEGYRTLAQQVLAICRRAGVPCYGHTYAQVAVELGMDGLHLPLPLLQQLSPEIRNRIPRLGASCHSLDDVLKAAALGADYVTLGHIFATQCKPGLPPRGLALLKEVCENSPIPVYAIGGITPQNLEQVIQAGAAGACMMSGFMEI